MKREIKIYSILFALIFTAGCYKGKKIETYCNPETTLNCSTNCKHNLKTQKIVNEIVTVTAIGTVDVTDIDDAINIIEDFYGYRCVTDFSKSITPDILYNGLSDVLDGDAIVRKYFSKDKVVYLVDKKVFGKGSYLRGIASTNGGTVVVRGEKSFLRETLIHELGHTLGLSHCNDLTCIMAVNNDQYDSGTFCKKCSSLIGYKHR